jgi:hypothetical protein
MNVSNVIGGLRSAASRLTHNGGLNIKAAQRAVTAELQARLAAPAAAARQVLSQYDMTNITPNNMANLVQQLSAKGAISPKDAQQLAAIPGELQNAGVGPNDSVNLLQFYQEQLSKVQSTAAQSPSAAADTSVSQLIGRMQSLARLAAARYPGGQGGVNAVA